MTLDSFRKELAEMAARRAAERLRDDEALREANAEHERRLLVFRDSAAHLTADILKPRMKLLSEYFDDFEYEAVEGGWGVRIAFNKSRLMLAGINLEILLCPAVDHNQLHVLYRLEVIPMLTDYSRVEEIVLPLDAVDEERLAAFVEEKLVSFMQTYLLLENDVAYQPRLAADRPRGPLLQKA